MASLASLVSITRQQFRFDPNGRVFADSELARYVNQAYKLVQRELGLLLDEKQIITTTAGVQEYPMPVFFKLKDVTLGRTYFAPLDEQAIYGREEQGRPSLYYLREDATGCMIGFFNIPDSAYDIQIHYKTYRPTIETSVDGSLSDEYDLLVALYASYLSEYTLRGNTPNATAKLQAYNQERARLGKGRYKVDVKFNYKR